MTLTVAVVATVDTKAAETEFIRSELTARGCRAVVVDVGLHRDRMVTGPDDVDAEEVAAITGSSVDELRSHARRDHAMATMAAGAADFLKRWRGEGALDAVLGIGGNQGTAIAAAAMRELPFGVPKYIVSTVASGNIRGYVGDSDIVFAFSVGDLLGGPNAVTGPILRQATAAVVAMAASASDTVSSDTTAFRPHGPRVAITAFGNTQTAVDHAIAEFTRAGVQVVPFHASGASGSAMERFIAEGMFDGVLDMTTHELLAELYPDDIYTPVRAGRLTAAGTAGLPQVVVPGGLEYHCFAAAETIPAALRDRATHHHNPNNTNVRSSSEELIAVARTMAERLNAATGPVAVMIPLRGWSQVGSPGGILHDPETNSAFIRELERRAGDGLSIRELPMAINDDGFGQQAARRLLALMGIGAEPKETGMR
ncbi:Tm-1-like ATP-binding domain-containing protein [Microbacterium soli]|uniref:Tm-1-like ATP-binding domain-containing protein n=1 Tax=Microbacterium soli TaxID=446075 RepID=A0ABP7NGQ9_9MICO